MLKMIFIIYPKNVPLVVLLWPGLCGGARLWSYLWSYLWSCFCVAMPPLVVYLFAVLLLPVALSLPCRLALSSSRRLSFQSPSTNPLSSRLMSVTRHAL